MAEVVLDANVIVALLYADDSLHQRAVDLTTRLENEGHSLVLVDFLVFEALSVLCRRAAQRKTTPPDLAAAVATMRKWFDNGEVRFLAHEAERLANSLLDIVTDSDGSLNANDALLIALQHEGAIDSSWGNRAIGRSQRSVSSLPAPTGNRSMASRMVGWSLSSSKMLPT